MSENIQAIPFIVLAVSLGVIGQVLMKIGMNQYRNNPSAKITGSFLKDLRFILVNPFVVSGFASYGISTIIWLYVLTRAELSFAYPFIAISYIAVILIGPYLFKEAIDGWKILAIVLIILGVFSMTVSEKMAESRAGMPEKERIARIADSTENDFTSGAKSAIFFGLYRGMQ